MDLLSNPLFIALIAFFIGIAGGIYIHKSKNSDNSQTNKLKSEKQALEAELDEYKASVAEHFEKTSALLNGLTDNYVKVYQHLAEGSQALTNADNQSIKLGLDEKQLTASIKQIEKSELSSSDDDDMEPPRDYAPKSAEKDSEGTLSEAFSIKNGGHKVEEVLVPAKQKQA